MKYFKITLIAFLSLACSLVFADASELQYKRITDLPTYTDGVPASGDIIPIYDVSANRVKQGTAQSLFGMSTETSVSSNTLTAAETGKTIYFNSTDGITQTLPAPAAGLKFKFRELTVSTSVTDHKIVTTSGANIIIGGVNELEVDTGDDGPISYKSAPSDTISFVSTAALPGDWISCEADSTGTYWFCDGQTFADGGVAYSSSI